MLRVRHNRKDGEFFLGCSAYPACRYAQAYDESLAVFIDWLEASLDLDMKRMIATAHPDKWPGNPLAHEVTVALNAMREKLQVLCEGKRR